jgi:DNA repair protein RadA/Sms
MKAEKRGNTVFLCQNCGYQAPKWMGRCPDCGEWNSLAEERRYRPAKTAPGQAPLYAPSEPIPIDAVETGQARRLATGISEFDRVLGGGVVPGSLILIGGDPGIGKSTIMLQVLHRITSLGFKALYISGEESVQQIKLRNDRLGAASHGLWVVSETNMESIRSTADQMAPDVIVVDSVQTIFLPDLNSAPGSVTQVREATMHLMFLAKHTGIPVFLIGHVTKEGAIAGPRLLEHMVDTVLYFEGGQNNLFRVLRAVKNRFGSTNEIGVFEMKENGLCEVANPSSFFLSERPCLVPGSVVTASMEGSRPILLEIQALVSRSSLGTPRRTVLGVDYNRVSLLVAIMEKKLGMQLMNEDIFVNVAGGVKIDEPAADLGIVSVIASSFFDKPVRGRTVVLGEIGLTGEVRAVSRVASRVAEAAKMGFERCLMPGHNVQHVKSSGKMELIGLQGVSEVVDLLF